MHPRNLCMFRVEGIDAFEARVSLTPSLKRGVNNMDHSDPADSFCAGCLPEAGRVAAARRAAFLRRKYATRRLRFTRTRSCCPMESLWIENCKTQWALQPIVCQ